MENDYVDFEREREDAEKAALELNLKVNDMYSKMSLDQERINSRKAMRTLHRVEEIYSKIRNQLNHLSNQQEQQLQQIHPEQLQEQEEQQQEQQHIYDDPTQILFEDDENVTTIKTIIRWWKTCLKLLNQLVTDEFGLVYDNIRQFLTQFVSTQSTIQEKIDSLEREAEITNRLEVCRKKLNRLKETAARKSKLAYQAKENLQIEIDGLEPFKGEPSVDLFLREAEEIIGGFEKHFPAAFERAKDKKARMLQNIALIPLQAQQDIVALNKKLEACVKYYNLITHQLTQKT